MQFSRVSKSEVNQWKRARRGWTREIAQFGECWDGSCASNPFFLHSYYFTHLLYVKSICFDVCVQSTNTTNNVYQLFPWILNLHFLSKFTTLVGRGMFHCVIDAMLRGGIFALDCSFSIHDFFHFQTKQSSSAIIFDHWDIFLPVNKNFSALKPLAQ